MASWKGRLGKLADFHRDVLKRVRKMKSDTDIQVRKKSEKTRKRPKRFITEICNTAASKML